MGMTTRRFSYQPSSQRIVFGAGARRDLGDECRRLGAGRLLLVATAGELARSRALLAAVAGRIAGEFTGVREHVPVEVAAAAREVAAAVSADGLLTVGGGSATGTAKAVALETGLPIVAVPTTYAGSEVTPVWGLTEGGHKRTGRSSTVLPKTVIYDPELTTSLPAAVTAASGMNAVAHCVEALALPGTDPVSALLAAEGVRVLAAGLPAVADDGADLGGRAEVLYGAFLAGSAFAVAGSGVHHKMCHVLGGRFELPHAPTHAVLLPHVAAHLTGTAPAGLDRVRAALSPPSTAGTAGSAAAGLYELAVRIGAPLALRDIGLAATDLDEAVAVVVEHVGLTEADAGAILRAAFGGERPEP